MPFYNWSQLPARERPGNRTLRVIRGDKVTMLRGEHVGPAMHETHVHEENEQVCSILEGEMEMSLGTETRLLRPGDVAVVPAGVAHGTRVVAGVRVVVLEFFAPPRGDLAP